MAFEYAEVVPWGRNYDEYIRMFDLRGDELRLKILGCGDGPASFNAEGNQCGGNITSIDPLYQFSKAEIDRRIQATSREVLDQTRRNQEKFRWTEIASVEALGRIRMSAMSVFLDSYEEGRVRGKYIPGALPHLPFPDQVFDIALCSHFLFLYTDNLSYAFHVASIREMLRVAREVRLFPLLEMNVHQSPYVQAIMQDFQAQSIEVRRVNYEFQIGGNEVLIVRNSGTI